MAHSRLTFRQAMELAERAGVSALHFSHHSPRRSDEKLEEIVQRKTDEAAARGLSLEVDAATENKSFHLGQRVFSPDRTTLD